jgi:hypothetical protein
MAGARGETYNSPQFIRCPIFPDTLDIQNGNDFENWLWEIRDEPHDNYWIDGDKVTYNIWHFLIRFAGELSMRTVVDFIPVERRLSFAKRYVCISSQNIKMQKIILYNIVLNDKQESYC